MAIIELDGHLYRATPGVLAAKINTLPRGGIPEALIGPGPVGDDDTAPDSPTSTPPPTTGLADLAEIASAHSTCAGDSAPPPPLPPGIPPMVPMTPGMRRFIIARAAGCSEVGALAYADGLRAVPAPPVVDDEDPCIASDAAADFVSVSAALRAVCPPSSHTQPPQAVLMAYSTPLHA